jgi:hypothetical protein
MPAMQAAIVRACFALGWQPWDLHSDGVETSARSAYVHGNTGSVHAAEANVSFCSNSARRKSDRGLLMDGFLQDMQ